ncbi:MAG TPA: hypothetical protein VIV60_33925 [Polyangiaceae bacterium]
MPKLARLRLCQYPFASMVVLGRSLLLLIALGCLPACASATRRGQSLYVEGRLIEAAEVFEHGEDQLARATAKDRVRYGLYRGATLLKLGDLDGASRWLYFAQQAETHHPGSLEGSDLQTLRLAFKDLDRRRALLQPVDPLTGAVAAEAALAAPDVVAPTPTPSARTSAPPVAAHQP